MFARQCTFCFISLFVCCIPFVGAADKPAQQTAQIRLYMPENPKGLIFEHPEATSNFVNYRDNQIAMMRSRLVIKAALDRPEIATLKSVRAHADPVAWIEKELHIDHPDGNEIIRLSMTGDNGLELGEVVHAVAQAYLDLTKEVAYTRRLRRMKELEITRKEYSDKLKALEEHRKRVTKEVAVEPKSKAYESEMTDREYNDSFDRLAKARMALKDLEFQNNPFWNENDAERKLLPARIAQAKKVVEYWTRDVELQETRKKVVHQLSLDDSEIMAQIEANKKILALIIHEMTKLEIEDRDPIRVDYFDDNKEKGKATIIEK